MSGWRHLRAILVLPGTVTLLVPALLLSLDGARIGSDWPPAARRACAAAGVGLALLGVALVVRTAAYFAGEGRGTLAPWDPTQRLVVRGPFRHVRNPMISGVFATLLGEAIAFRSLALLGWFAFFLIGNLVYVPLSEEPGLVKRFGEEYARYRRNVPRWIPRRTPWDPGPDTDAPQRERAREPT